jgi:CRP/FNR family transcriptional regulator
MELRFHPDSRRYRHHVLVAAFDLGVAFAGLPPHIRERIAAVAVPCKFRPKQIVFRSGDSADGLYIVLSGRIRVSRETPNHVELLHTETAGGVLGEIPVFGGGQFPATAVATEATRCAKLPTAAVERLLRESPEFSRYALARLASRAQSLLRRIDELTATTITARLAQHVLARAEADREFTLGMSQAALADDLGTAREVVVRAIAALVRMRAIRRVGRSRFALISRSTLQSIVGASPRR